MSRAAAKPEPSPGELTLQVEYVPINKVLRYAHNTRDHSDAQIDQIAASIRANGFVNPCLVDANGVLIAGHGRVSGAERAGLKTVPIIRLGHLSETQARALRIADNAIALNATWNSDLLRLELTELELEGFDMTLTGFDDIQLVTFMANVPTGKDPEAVPEPPATPVSKRGDLWMLGNHRLLCGDATSAEDVARLLGEAKPHLMVTDPPYGVEYDPEWRFHAKGPDGRRLSKGDVSMGKFEDVRVDWNESWKLFPGDVAYIWHSAAKTASVLVSLEDAGLLPRCQIIWAKHQIVIGRGDYHWQHEPCWYVVRKGKVGHWAGDRKQSSVWEINNLSGASPKDDGATSHGTQKPIECMKRPIENNSRPGDAVYDPFLGSGTTLIAAEMTARKCFGLEIDPGYCDVIIKRWETFAGKEATLDAPGKPTYARVQADRAKPALKRKRAPRTAERV